MNASKSVSFLFKDKTKKLLIRDGDTKFPKEFDELFKSYNARVKKIPYRSPNLNPYAEGFVGTIKRECLEHFFVFGERHFEYLAKRHLRHRTGLNRLKGILPIPALWYAVDVAVLLLRRLRKVNISITTAPALRANAVILGCRRRY